jgi:hypothetical protein
MKFAWVWLDKSKARVYPLEIVPAVEAARNGPLAARKVWKAGTIRNSAGECIVDPGSLQPE